MEQMLMVIIAMCLTFPFAFIGITVATNFAVEFLKVRAGWIKVRMVMPNGRETARLVKPMGKGIELKIFGKQRTYSFDSKKMTFQGNTPIQTWNVDDITPLDLLNPKIKNAISAEELSNIVIRAFNLGVISSMNKEKLLTLLMYISLGIMALIAIMVFQQSDSISGLSNLMTTVSTNVNSIMANQAVVLK